MSTNRQLIQEGARVLDDVVESVNTSIDTMAKAHARLAHRHAELAALVSKLTVATEALEAKVRELDSFYGVSDRVKPGIDPPDIGNLPDTGTTWTDSTDGAEFNQGEGVT